MTSVPSTSTSAVRAATHRALEARERFLAEYPQWDDWRRQVRAAKAAMVEGWPEYLALLRERVESWGGKVYFAKTAAEANDFILRVARRHDVARVVQSKSMTVHEIGLARFLADRGINLTETDLGEFIIQLAGHPPAHLTAPALHLNRFQIARLLSDHLFLEAPSEPAALARLASDYLAGCYKEADLGLTGVNFAAAQEGVLVCLENEGNLHSCASLPPVHLALMGWEKMVPCLADLEPCLRLLPASATGQRLTSLVHFIKGLKGAQAFYLVILDNGRSRMAAHPELREALYCLRCGSCLNICPVFQLKGAHLYGRVYPGAIGALLAPFLPPSGDITDFCTQCGSCGPICPAAIELPKKIKYLRQKAPSFRRIHLLTQAAGLVLGQPRLYRGLESLLHAWFQGLGRLQARKFLGQDIPAHSFFHTWKEHKAKFAPSAPSQSGLLTFPGARLTTTSPETGAEDSGTKPGTRGSQSGPTKPGPPPAPDFSPRWTEAGSCLVSLSGTASLARYLAETAQGEIWLEDHPILQPVAGELLSLGVPAQTAAQKAPPELDTAVTRGLDLLPELGAVLVAGGQGPVARLPWRARHHVVVVPHKEDWLDFQGALKLVKNQPDSMITWLAGPTRTADIEKILVLGAQGPAKLTIILYQPDPSEE
ncbi:MAG: LUD domain-containing protein [Desulfobaccales bacterium]